MQRFCFRLSLLALLFSGALNLRAQDSFADYFQADSQSSLAIGNTAGLRTSFDLDTDCEWLTLSVIDPAEDPLPAFNAYQVNPTDNAGNDITDITGNTTITMRARSLEEVSVSFLFRSGGGTMAERTDRIEMVVPAGLEAWTEFTVTFTAAEYAGFDPTDLRDCWFYLDRGELNFPGNFFVIDHITVGATPDPAQNSPCEIVNSSMEYVSQFIESTSTAILSGRESERLTLNVTNCEEVSVEVTDPAGTPFGAFRPIVIAPINDQGLPISNIAGNTNVFIRARSAEAVPMSVLFRSGDGSTDFRTMTLTDTVQGDLTGWSNLTFSFSEDDLAGFDATDLIDMWLYLDRDNDNFPGNDLYIDYIAIGSKPDAAQQSPCGLPDLMTSTNEATWAGGLRLYPNPTGGLLTVDIPRLSGTATRIESRLVDLNGRTVRQPNTAPYTGRLDLDLSGLPAGIYILQLTDARGGRALRRVVKR